MPLLFGILFLLRFNRPTAAFYSPTRSQQRDRVLLPSSRRYRSIREIGRRYASQTNTQLEKNNSAKMRQRGIYSRPSAAIERGSGFYVPGLEGFRVRILVASVVLILNYVNSQYSAPSPAVTTDINTALITSQWLIMVFASILFIQGLVEWRKEVSPDSASSLEVTVGNRKDMDQIVSSSFQQYDGDAIDAIRWVTASFVAMTPTTHLLLIRQENNHTEILYALGDFIALNGTNIEKELGMESAIKAVFEDSVGVRVAIGSSHPASVTLLPEATRRCVLLQRLESPSDPTSAQRKVRLCLMTGSSNILESYTKNDLIWLGRLARYIEIHLQPLN